MKQSFTSCLIFLKWSKLKQSFTSCCFLFRWIFLKWTKMKQSFTSCCVSLLIWEFSSFDKMLVHLKLQTCFVLPGLLFLCLYKCTGRDCTYLPGFRFQYIVISYTNFQYWSYKIERKPLDFSWKNDTTSLIWACETSVFPITIYL